jgi:hypothetical protein
MKNDFLPKKKPRKKLQLTKNARIKKQRIKLSKMRRTELRENMLKN